MEFLRMDLFPGGDLRLTPKGDVKQLPVGATPIDFAFAVHTEVGSQCAGAKVNGRIAPLSRDAGEWRHGGGHHRPRRRPNRDWLAFVKTARARQKIRQWARRQEFDSSLKLGKDLLDREIRKRRLDKPSRSEMTAAAEVLSHPGFEHVWAALGKGDVGPTAVLKALFPGYDPSGGASRAPTAIERIAEKLRKPSKGVRIQGMDNMMVRFSLCCQPVPGDAVIGYVTRGGGFRSTGSTVRTF